MKRALYALFLFLASAPVFPQTRQDALVYVLDIDGGTMEERRFFKDSLGMEIPTGYALTGNILEADYALSCYLTDSREGPLLMCSLLDAKSERELVSTNLLYTAPDEARTMLPYMLWSMFANLPLKQPEPEKEIAELEKETPAHGETAGEAGGSPAPAQASGWRKPRGIFLNLRTGLSSRYYIGGSDTAPTASILTFDGGFEPELRLFNFLALQMGLNFALDRAEYRRSPSNPSPMVYATSVLSVPLMVKYIFTPSPLTTLGPCLGSYWTTPLLGAARPPPFGILAGLDLSVKTALGIIVFDLRYSADLGLTYLEDSALTYRRMFLTLSAGYKFDFSGR